ncbi:murein L,D-transpeptidase catalytic domain family protein [uncultured Ilyobacter sp.]|uniref:murein L,D-transpeptidase catalytic domain family protein n=1 Tax=uncultured Ilyobacter sp. TaxID=544433 RepID=UPI0029C640EA|nr:murein L,D-transpeptidase catalytic domain family protein [uncultured Ilyobacter sp.]
MRKRMIEFIVLLSLLMSSTSYAITSNDFDLKDLYAKINLKEKVGFEIFRNAIAGYQKIKEKKNASILTIIDYTKPSTEQRFFVLDIENKKLLYETYVAHGAKTGDIFAEKFSNNINSHKSSVGFFLTDETYVGSKGYSLRLEGLEEGINDNARKRAIVIHAADYANPDFIKSSGRLGRSWGCPALPENLSPEIIDTIKNGSVLFVNGNDSNYVKKSKFI